MSLSTGAEDAGTGALVDETEVSMQHDELGAQSRKFLLERIDALTRQLTIRNADCSRLVRERCELLPLREKCQTQRELILALKAQVTHLTEVQKESTRTIERLERRLRDEVHARKMEHYERELDNDNVPDARPPTFPQPAAAVGAENNATCNGPAGRCVRPPGGTVVTTTLGPQIIYDSSDISSVGFSKRSALPVDFLGGAAHCQAWLVGGRANTDVGVDQSSVTQQDITLQQLKTLVDHQNRTDAEEDRALRERLEALRRRS